MAKKQVPPVPKVPPCPPVPPDVKIQIAKPAELQQSAAAVDAYTSGPPAVEETPQSESAAPEPKASPLTGNSKVDLAVQDAVVGLQLGVGEEERVYATPIDQANPTAYLLRGKRMKKWLRKRSTKRGKLLKKDEVNEVIDNLEAIAAADESLIVVYQRVGPSAGGGIEIDLGTPDGKRIKLYQGTAKVISSGSKVHFVRSELMQPMPMPAEQGDWKAILPFLNMSHSQKLLLIAWITFCLTHHKCQSAYPVLAIRSALGTGKSLLCKLILRPLIDNSSVGVQMFPDDIQQFVISCQNQFMLIFDNTRFISKKWSDAFCVGSTSGTMSKRKLYSDAEELVMQVHAPIVINGIHNVVLEPDLASRTLTITLDPITPETRKDESVLVAEIAAAMPFIYRGILDLSAKILDIESSMQSAGLSRLTDFSRWLAAMEQVLELSPGELQRALQDNQNDAMLDSIHDHPLAAALLSFAEGLEKGEWKGSSTQLLRELNEMLPYSVAARDNSFPSGPIALSKQLRSIAKLMESQKILIEFGRGKDRWISITNDDLY